MKQKIYPGWDFLKLRGRSENALSAQPEMAEDFTDFSSREPRNAIDEPPLLQLELDMQNDEWRKSRLECKVAKNKYCDLRGFAPIGCFMMSEKGMILEANHTGAAMLGVENGSLLGKQFTAYIAGESQDVFYLHRKNLFKTKTKETPLTCELKLRNKEGADFHALLSSTIAPDDEGRFSRIRAAVSNIDKLKRVEMKLRRAKEEADAASRAKSVFLANMSHEIRTPMNVILGMNRLALESAISPVQQGYLDTVQQSSESLLYLLNDILDYSKIEAGRVRLEKLPFDLEAVLKEVVKTFSAKTREKGLELSYRLPSGQHTSLVGDENRLRQILINLVGNAVKFTDAGAIRIAVEESAQDENEVLLQFSVKDTGIGVPTDVQDAIFDQFTQADSRMSEKFGGTGLGLAICKMLTELSGGKIWVESEPGEGSAFYFTARYSKCDPGSVRSKTSDCSEKVCLPSLDVLVVEDNRLNRNLARIVLEKAGHSVICAGNGVEALENLSSNRYDVILMDVRMPKLNGIETTRLIRNCEKEVDIFSMSHQALLTRVQKKIRGTRTPIIAMTAHAMSDDRGICIAAGMDDHVTKPFKFEDMLKVIALAADSRLRVQKKIDSSPVQERRPCRRGPVIIGDLRRRLVENYEITPEQASHLLEGAHKSLNEEFNNAEESISRGDPESLSNAAHSIRGALENLGLFHLADLANRIERKQVRNMEKATDAMNEQLNVLRKGVAPLMKLRIEN